MDNHKELPSWNDHYDETLQLALKHTVWTSQISFLAFQTELLSSMQHLSPWKQWNWQGTLLSRYFSLTKKSQAFFKASSVKGAISSFTLIPSTHSLLKMHLPAALPSLYSCFFTKNCLFYVFCHFKYSLLLWDLATWLCPHIMLRPVFFLSFFKNTKLLSAWKPAW